jgi:peptide/nickel transport system ATP-binding protein
MFKGKIVESGKVSKLFRKPEHPYTKGLIACRPVPGEHPFRLPTLSDFMDPGKLPDDPSYESVSKQDTFQDKLPLLEVNNLRVDYILKKNLMGKPVNSLHAVDSVSFNIIPGETLGLIGESGCGKSTLGRSIIRLIRAGEGEILYHGADISSLKGKGLISFRQKVQFIFQDPYSSLNPRIAIGPSIMEIMKVHGIHKTRTARRNAVMELLARVGLGLEHFERYPHEFSGGQRQRIGLARALATGPELIICDESVSSLDVSVQAMILNLLNDLKDSFNLTYLFISHDLSVIEYMSDEIAVMYLGKIVERFPVNNLMYTVHPYTRALIASVPLVDPKKRGKKIPIGGEVPDATDPPSGCSFHPRCNLRHTLSKGDKRGDGDQCTTEKPELRSVLDNEGHVAACHWFEKYINDKISL